MFDIELTLTRSRIIEEMGDKVLSIDAVRDFFSKYSTVNSYYEKNNDFILRELLNIVRQYIISEASYVEGDINAIIDLIGEVYIFNTHLYKTLLYTEYGGISIKDNINRLMSCNVDNDGILPRFDYYSRCLTLYLADPFNNKDSIKKYSDLVKQYIGSFKEALKLIEDGWISR